MVTLQRAPRARSSPTSQAGSAGGPKPSGPVGCQGGKHLGEVRAQCRLILFHRQQVIAPGVHDLRTQLPLGEQPVTGHHSARKGHLLEHRRGGGQFMTFARRAQLGNERLAVVGIHPH